MRLIDLRGQRFGRLTVVERANEPGRRVFWRCVCDCGTEHDVVANSLRNGNTRSCGCLRAEVTAERSLTHGHTVNRRHTPTYRAWVGAKGRCFRETDHKYPQYGGRGISMCDRWADSFEAFLEDMGECPADHSLDRIDPDGDYTPENCRWATNRQQARTRTDNVFVEWNGETFVLKDLARHLGLRYQSLHYHHRMKGRPLAESVDRAIPA